MSRPPKPTLPIGYWLKRADALITEHADKVQAANGLSRFEWQVLNLLQEAGEANREHIFETMRTFVDAPGLDAMLGRFQDEGWVEQYDDGQHGETKYRLTEAGRRHHGIALAAQQQARQRLMEGISREEYETVLRVLQRIVSNLDEEG